MDKGAISVRSEVWTCADCGKKQSEGPYCDKCWADIEPAFEATMADECPDDMESDDV